MDVGVLILNDEIGLAWYPGGGQMDYHSWSGARKRSKTPNSLVTVAYA
jgi:hypothetical protein